MFDISFVLNLTNALKDALKKAEKLVRENRRLTETVRLLEEDLSIKTNEASMWRGLSEAPPMEVAEEVVIPRRPYREELLVHPNSFPCIYK